MDCKFSNPKVQSKAELASHPTPSHLFHFNLLSSSYLSLPLSLSFPLFSCHSLFLSLSLLKTLSISTHTFSIKLAYQFSFGFFFQSSNSRSSSPACLATVQPTYTTARCRSPYITYLHWLTPSLSFVCLFAIYPPLVIFALSLNKLICALRYTIFLFWWWGWKIMVLIVTSTNSFTSKFPLKNIFQVKPFLSSPHNFCILW